MIDWRTKEDYLSNKSPFRANSPPLVELVDFYGFSRIPLGKQISSKEIFKTKSFSEAMAMLELGVVEEDILLLTGSIGSGKFLVLRASYEALDINSYQPVYLRGTGPC